MAGTARKWLVGCGIGCATAALLGGVLLVGGGLVMMRPFNRAIDVQKELTAQFGAREDFAPAADGFSDDRLRVFLAVRRDLMPMCGRFQAVAVKFRAMDELGADGGAPSAGDAVGTILPAIRSAFGVVGDIGRYLERRNASLREHGMGLGEYVWYYVLVYDSWLGHPPNVDFEGAGGGGWDPAERRVLSAQLARAADALRAAGRPDEAALWSAQADSVLGSATGVPFGPGGLPAAWASHLEPWRGRLEAVYCEATSSFEPGRVRRRGLSVHTD